MPYRRLPNTDIARIRALKQAIKKGDDIIPYKLSFSQKLLHDIKIFLPYFEQAINVYKESYSKQVAENKIYIDKQRKAKLYLSHFIQVINLSIIRSELQTSIKKLYGLEDFENKIPALNSEKEILFWGEKIIQAEQSRIAKGHTPITNPTIAKVKVFYEQFVSAHQKQNALKERSNHDLENVAKLRIESDKNILQLWNEIENKYSKLPADLKREKSIEYGVIYVYRKNETHGIVNVNYQVS